MWRYLVVALLLAGCTSQPIHPPVEPKVPPSPTEDRQVVVTPDIEPIKISHFFGDSTQYLIAVTENDEIEIIYHRGGAIPIQEAANELHRLTGKTARVVGRCISACTMMIIEPTLSWTCEARFGFHGVSYYRGGMPVYSEEETEKMAKKYYPTKLREKLNEVGALDGLDLTFLTGQEVSDLTGKGCE